MGPTTTTKTVTQRFRKRVLIYISKLRIRGSMLLQQQLQQQESMPPMMMMKKASWTFLAHLLLRFFADMTVDGHINDYYDNNDDHSALLSPDLRDRRCNKRAAIMSGKRGFDLRRARHHHHDEDLLSDASVLMTCLKDSHLEHHFSHPSLFGNQELQSSLHRDVLLLSPPQNTVTLSPRTLDFDSQQECSLIQTGAFLPTRLRLWKLLTTRMRADITWSYVMPHSFK